MRGEKKGKLWANRFILGGVALAVISWIDQVTRDALLYGEQGSILYLLLPLSDVVELIYRVLACSLLVAAGVAIQVAFNRQSRAEEAVRRQERRFRSLIENASDTITILDADGTVRYVSPTSEMVTGYRPEERVGHRVFGMVHPDDVERASSIFAEILKKSGLHPPFEFRVPYKDGSWRYLEVVVNNLLDDPAVGGIVVYSRDITERKRAEEELRQSETRNRTILEAIPDLILRLSREGEYLDFQVNEDDELYVPREEIIGKNLRDTMPPEVAEPALRRIAETLDTGEMQVFEYRLPMAEGMRDYEARMVVNAPGEVLCVVRDVTQHKALKRRLEQQAFYDLLTDLPNRHLFMDRLKQALRHTRRKKGRQVAALFMDLDNFKVVNDSLGHEVGDRLLVAVGERLKGCLRPEDTLARFGGDEFTVLIEDGGDPADAVRMAERLTEVLREPFVLDGRELFVKPSIGVALGTSRTKNPEDLLRDADTAMYQAKAENSGYRVFERGMYEQVMRHLKLENELRRATESEEFVVHYQPIIDLRSEEGEVWGVEALVRWQHPERGLLDPEDFVAAAEESGLVVPMGERVLKEACYQAREWQESYPHVPPLVMAVNLSAMQLGRPDLATTIEEVLRESRLKASSLSLDITETLYIKALEAHNAALDELKRLGVHLSIDDFGVGYSSLSYLKSLPADTLKIDKSFIRGLGEDVENTALVRMMIDLAHTLGMEVVAEGVESEGQAQQLKEMSCDLAQGYFFTKPLPPEAVPEFLAP